MYRPSAEEAHDSESGLGGNREYFVTLGADWDDVREALGEEQRVFAEHAGDVDAAGDAHDERVEDEEQGDPWLWGLDVGVAGTVIALAAAGFLTVSSCNGGTDHHEASPVVAFVADDVRLSLVAGLASDSGLTFTRGALSVVEGDLSSFGEFARALLERRAEFDALERPREEPSDDDDPNLPLYPSWG